MGKKEINPLQYSMRLLSFRARSEGELRKRLKQRKVPPEDIEKTLQTLREWNLLDDINFVREFIHSKISRGPYSRTYIFHRLRFYGVSPEIINRGIEKFYDIGEVIKKSLNLYRKLLNLYGDDFCKIYGYFARRGFNREWLNLIEEKLQESQ